MEEKNNTETKVNNLCKCPHCSCCFCNEVDLKRHVEIFGASQSQHLEEFRRTHGRLEHGSFGGPE